MKKQIFTFLFLLVLSSAYCQSKFILLKSSSGIECYYKIKDLKSDQKRIVIKFKNKTKKNFNLNIEFGLYVSGILEEKAVITTCHSKGFWYNWFATQHAIINEEVKETELVSEDFKLEVIEFQTEETEACEKTHS